MSHRDVSSRDGGGRLPDVGTVVSLPERLISVRREGDISWPYWLPATPDGENVYLERGEQLLWQGRSGLSSPGPVPFQLPPYAPTTLVVTDRRCCFAAPRPAENKSSWSGFGVVGLTVAITANAVESASARRRVRGQVLLGHVRYEWVSAVVIRHEVERRRSRRVLVLVVPTQLGQATVEISVDEEHSVAIAGLLVAAAARCRASLGGASLTAADHQKLYDLQQQRVAGRPMPDGSLVWDLPGPVELLIDRGVAALGLAASPVPQQARHLTS